jgi:hypothetical protein
VEAVAGSGPAGVEFPHALVDLRLENCDAGSTVTFTLVFPDALPAGTSFWKWGPAPGNAVAHWYELPAEISGATVTYTIVDGGLGDDDLAPNGVIEDPGGTGLATPVPTMTSLAVALLGLLMLVIARPRMRAA